MTSNNSPETQESADQQPLEERVGNRSQPPRSSAFKDFMGTQWAASNKPLPERASVADHAARRRAALSAKFPGERLVIPAGPLKTRSNDTDYRFRPHSGFAHMTGLGVDHEPDAVLILEPLDEPAADGSNHEATLYFRPLAGRDSEQFYADPRYGEFWVGPRPTLQEIESEYGIRCQDLSDVEVAITKNAGPQALGGVRVRLLREVDLNVDALVDTSRLNTSVDLEESDSLDGQLTEALSELRLVKDEEEIANLRRSIASTKTGFENIVRAFPQAREHHRGERIVEGAFFAAARAEGNDVGYETIAACGNNATVLHWIRNNGTVEDGKLILVDAGVEDDTLYTADITRTMPVDGTFTAVQKKIYDAVLKASDAAFEVAVPGNRFRDVHAAAMKSLAESLDEWGLLPCSVEEAISDNGGQHRRWMPHGTSHHLGLDVHDCAQAKRDLYLDGIIEPGMVFTIEPGLYFKEDDLAVPEEYRGIGIRLEDDVLITEDGPENMSAGFPRTTEDIESWIAELSR
ncbi:M24 family metallopeptidase [Kocuria koreensis]|jgi:Xaa-Pro aminopeptidase|uniref:Xaa-Pro aminopeptidase n=1 Tax=Rothia koreensis TaxID=592378 RepID=A0A7K1LFM6_9MICC|nr:aminopeptidase P family protein [Rothia koreensis]MUN53991.1 M24 family metallopeptidase [Rothia koreensis]